MQAFLQSAFLQALAHSLAASIWQMALLWVVTIILLKFLKLTSAQKFNIAFLAQLSGLVLFIYTFYNAYNDQGGKIIGTAVPAGFLVKADSFIVECMPYIAVIYLCILLIKLSRFIFSYNESKTLKYSLKS